MREIVIGGIVLYFLVGTMFLCMFLTGYLRLDMQNKKTGKWLDDVSIFVLSYCLWWPLLIVMLILGRRKDDEQ